MYEFIMQILGPESIVTHIKIEPPDKKKQAKINFHTLLRKKEKTTRTGDVTAEDWRLVNETLKAGKMQRVCVIKTKATPRNKVTKQSL